MSNARWFVIACLSLTATVQDSNAQEPGQSAPPAVETAAPTTEKKERFAHISEPYPVYIQDFMTFRKVRIEVTLGADQNALLGMVTGAAHVGSVPAEPWQFLPYVQGSSPHKYRGYVYLPPGNSFHVIAKVPLEGEVPGLPASPPEIDYPTRGPISSGRSFAKPTAVVQESVEVSRGLLSTIDVKVKPGRILMEFKPTDPDDIEEVRINVLEKEEVAGVDDLSVQYESPYNGSYPAVAGHTYWAFGYVKYKRPAPEEPEPEFFLSRGPIRIKGAKTATNSAGK